MDKHTEKLRRELLRLARTTPSRSAEFTPNPSANRLILDLDKHPHAFVLGCIMDRQVSAEKAWAIPWELKRRFGTFVFSKLARKREREWRKAMTSPTHLHRYSSQVARDAYRGIQRIHEQYGGDASRIWADSPPSATIVRRMLEFDGVGQKIATMTANILASRFQVPLSDYYSIDISVDVQVRRVLTRLGLARPDASNEVFVYLARELNPRYPGILDVALWELGRETCRPTEPMCEQCPLGTLCPGAVSR